MTTPTIRLNARGTRRAEARVPRTSPKGRTCDSCGTALSVYNPQTLCGPCLRARNEAL